MPFSTEYFDAPGKSIASEMLSTPKGISVWTFLRQAGAAAFAEPVSCRRTADPASDVVVVRIKVERPQRCVNAIRHEEMVALQFWDSDNTFPEVLALRKDFPHVPHTNLRSTEFPRSLCLYDEPYVQLKHNWTPARFIARVRYWLEKTAIGTLHGEDQPLESLLISSRTRLVLPFDFIEEQAEQDQVFEISCIESSTGDITLIAEWKRSNREKAKHIAVVLQTPPVQHGIIRSQPENLFQLQQFCTFAGLDLQTALSDKLKSWFLNKPHPSILNYQFVILLMLPKVRIQGGPIERIEAWAFLSLKSIQDVGIALGVCGTEGGRPGLVIGKSKGDEAKLKDVPLGTLQVTKMPSAHVAAVMNNQLPFNDHMMAIGAGALGSQVLLNLVRSGFGKWTVVDQDTFLAHNLCRHALSAWAVGMNKADAVVRLANDIILPGKSGSQIATAIPADIMFPGKYEKQLLEAHEKAVMVLDLSASIAVSRFLSGTATKTRNVSAFITPTGNSLVILVEDQKRLVRLDWLEMVHYRAVINEQSLSHTLSGGNQRVRYGNSCRDVSSTLPQDFVAEWAAQVSRSVKTLSDDGPTIQIYVKNEHGETRKYLPEISSVFHANLNEWVIRFDNWLLEKMVGMRQAKLPNETGGVLLGNFDAERKICSIIDLLPAPPDSKEWPTSYIRGCVGLRDEVTAIENKTSGQITYAGEWHSHPKGAAVVPSNDDLNAYNWLLNQMDMEGLPGLMMIIGDASRYCFVGSEPVKIPKSKSKRKK